MQLKVLHNKGMHTVDTKEYNVIWKEIYFNIFMDNLRYFI